MWTSHPHDVRLSWFLGVGSVYSLAISAFLCVLLLFLYPVMSQTDRISHTWTYHYSLKPSISFHLLYTLYQIPPFISASPKQGCQLSGYFLQTDCSVQNAAACKASVIKPWNSPSSWTQNNIISPLSFSTHPCINLFTLITLLSFMFLSIILFPYLPSVFRLSPASPHDLLPGLQRLSQ